MIEPKALEALKSRYSHLHPLLVHRSMERSESAGEMFDILSTVPERYPVVWNDETRRWDRISDLTLSHRFDFTIVT